MTKTADHYPSLLGPVVKTIFVWNMNWHKSRVRQETKNRMLLNVRDACSSFVEWYDG